MSQYDTNPQGFYSDNYGAAGIAQQQQGGGYGQAMGQPVQQEQYGYSGQQGSYGGYGEGQDNWAQQGQGYEMPPTGGGGYTGGQPQTYTQGTYSGEVMDVDPTPGTMGQMAPRDSMDDRSGGYGFEDEPPLLEELGIDFALIKENTLSVLNPLKAADAGALSNTDMAGPLVFCLLFGVVLLMTGKVHFGYIYGVGLLGCSSLYVVLNLMSVGGVSIGCVVSVLGYCLLPMVLLSVLSVVVSLNGIVGMPLALLFVCWCSYSASKLFVSVLSMHSMQLLVAYPCALIYGVFALLTVF